MVFFYSCYFLWLLTHCGCCEGSTIWSSPCIGFFTYVNVVVVVVLLCDFLDPHVLIKSLKYMAPFVTIDVFIFH